MKDRVDGWMPLHIGRYMSATGHLSNEEHGMYLLLLMHAWANDGVIPGDPDRVRRICRADPKAWAKASSTILDFLTAQPDGTYRQKRLDIELARAAELKNAKAEAGKKGAEARWQTHGGANGKTADVPMANECPIPLPKQEPEKQTPVEAAPLAPTTVAPPPPAAPSAPREFPSPGDQRVVDLHGLMRAERIQAYVVNAQQFVFEGGDEELLRRALSRARKRGKPAGLPIPWKFFEAMLADVRAGLDADSYDQQTVFAQAMANIAAKEAKNASH